ncbi:MAG: hypothetical protein ACPKQO_05475 [Nitrososphaeraceae archaeon]
MLGDLIYEGKNRTTNSRVLNAEENKVEHNFTEEGRFKEDIDIIMIGTFWTVSVDDNVVYGEGQHVITTKDGGETATFKGYGIGRFNPQSKGISYRGTVFYKTSSKGKLAFLNNMTGVFEAEADESGVGVVKIWEWK